MPPFLGVNGKGPLDILAGLSSLAGLNKTRRGPNIQAESFDTFPDSLSLPHKCPHKRPARFPV